MLLLSHISHRMRIAVLLLWAVGLAGLAAFTLAAGFGVGDPGSTAFQVLYACLYLVPAALCLLRAALIREERVAWAIFGIGMAAWAAGYGHYFLFLQDLESPPYPSPSDAFWLLYYGTSFLGLMLLMRERLRSSSRGFWIEAAVGGLALAAVSAALLVEPILVSTGGSVAAVATNLTYPLLDLLLVSLVLGVFALSGWRPTRGWLILGGVFAAQGAFDTVYLYQAASGTYETGTLLDTGWVIAMLTIALVAWRTPEVTQGSRLEGWPAVTITGAFAVVGLFLTTYDHWHRVNDVALILATLTLVVAFVRTAMTFGDMKSLQESRELLVRTESILNSAGEGIYGLDREGRTTFANPAAARMTGHEVGELIGRRSHELVHHSRTDGTHFPAEECPVTESLRDGTVHQADDGVYWRKDGTSFPVEFTSTPIAENGRVQGAVVVFKDISERRAVERTKDEFTSMVSHELRTPLTSIRGSLGLLESGVLGPLPEKGQRMVRIAVENTDRLVRLINDILDIERIHSGAIDMHKQPCDAAELVSSAVELIQPMAAEASVTLSSDASPAPLLADPDRIQQTLTNLLSNAVKFSPAGSAVRVCCARRDGEVLFQVIDEGRGIPAEKLESIFERFQQVDASDSREKGGTGLGLAICRTIVDHHDGRIWAQSEPGEGSRLSFVLPALSEEQAAPADREGPGGPLVLVCDDDAAVVEVVGAVLEQRGYRVISAHSGEQALERAIAERPDAILLDMLMPGMSGWETAAVLKEQPETRGIPVVILSVLPRFATERPGGPVADWIEKPLDEEALFRALGRAIAPPSEPCKVLIVEDDLDLAGILAAMFRRRGIDTFHAADGREAIGLAQQVLPDLLVLDLGLPEADGFEVVDWLRGHDRLGALPMVVYTGQDLDEGDRERLKLGSGTQFFTKGRVTPEDFERRVMAMLERLTQDCAAEGRDEPEAHPAGR